jgi:glycine/D-amino acid oxidase-like deaminating enzyme
MHTDPFGLWGRTAPPAPPAPRLTEALEADVVVVGAGYTGLSAALHLAEAGVGVIVLEAAEIGFGGSGRNVGLVNAGLWLPPTDVIRTLGTTYGERLVTLLSDAPSLVFDLIERHGIDCEATRTGTLHCAVGRGGLKQLEARAAQWQARGAPVRLLDRAEAEAKTGSGAFAGALLDRRAGTIQPLAYARGLAKAAAGAGARLFVRSPVVSAARHDGRWTARTPEGAVSTEWIVVATNAYTRGLWPEINAELVRIPLFNFATPPLSDNLRRAILPERQGAWDTRQVLSWFRLDGAGRLVFGSLGALEGAGAAIHRAYAKRALARIFPALGNVTFESEWYGMIDMTADNVPRLHALAPQMIGFSGYNGRGIAPGTAFGRVLADHIGGRIEERALPLPFTPPKPQRLRALKEAVYGIGAQLAHFAGARS